MLQNRPWYLSIYYTWVQRQSINHVWETLQQERKKKLIGRQSHLESLRCLEKLLVLEMLSFYSLSFIHNMCV